MVESHLNCLPMAPCVLIMMSSVVMVIFTISSYKDSWACGSDCSVLNFNIQDRVVHSRQNQLILIPKSKPKSVISNIHHETKFHNSALIASTINIKIQLAEFKFVSSFLHFKPFSITLHDLPKLSLRIIQNFTLPHHSWWIPDSFLVRS